LEQKLLSVQNLSKTYVDEKQQVEALKGVSFELERGEMLAIMGTSGSGKSTLLNILAALDKPDAGEILVEGVHDPQMFIEPHATQYRARNIGFVFQSFNLLEDLTAEENIALPLILQGYTADSMKEQLDWTLGFLKLKKWRDHLPSHLSGGQQQRVAIGRALIADPPIILADEPTGNLDYNTSTDVLKVLVATKERLNQSIIMVTHDPGVAAYADRILFFHDGHIVDQYVCTKTADDMANILGIFKKLLEGAA